MLLNFGGMLNNFVLCVVILFSSPNSLDSLRWTDPKWIFLSKVSISNFEKSTFLSKWCIFNQFFLHFITWNWKKTKLKRQEYLCFVDVIYIFWFKLFISLKQIHIFYKYQLSNNIHITLQCKLTLHIRNNNTTNTMYTFDL